MFLNYVNNYRGLAILLIIGSHSIWWLIDWQTVETAQILRVLFNNSSTVFVFIAGFLFQHLIHKYQTQRYFKQKLLYIILPYILVSLPAIYKSVFVDTVNIFTDYPIYQQVVLYYLTGEHGQQFWFVPMISIFYLIAPLLVYLDKHKPSQFYALLPLFFIISLFFTHSVSLTEVNNIGQSYLHFFSIYVFGMFLSHYKKEFFIKIAPFAHLLILIWLVAMGLQFVIQYAYFKSFFYGQIFDFIKWLAFISFTLYFLQKHDNIVGKRLDKLADMSFGIFFIHGYVMTALALVSVKLTEQAKFTLLSGIGGDVLHVALFFSLIGLIAVTSMLCLWLAKLVLGRYSRMVVGY